MTNHDVHPLELFRRDPANPILSAVDFPRMVNTVFNPAATVFEGETLLLVRVEFRSGLSHLAVATSPNGRTDWTIDHDRRFEPRLDTFEEQWGIEDPRITKVGDEYMIVYTGYSAGGPLVCLATTTRLPNLRASRGVDVARGQGRGAVPRPVRWTLGPHPPTGAPSGPRSTRVAVVEPGPAALGRCVGPPRRPGVEGGGTRTRSASGHRRCSRRTGG